MYYTVYNRLRLEVEAASELDATSKLAYAHARRQTGMKDPPLYLVKEIGDRIRGDVHLTLPDAPGEPTQDQRERDWMRSEQFPD